MTLRIIQVDERLKNKSGVKMVIFGPFGIGKTSLLKTLEQPTLCIDMEAGLLAVQDWPGDVVSIRTWKEARDLACLLGGPNPACREDQPYSPKHYEYVCATYKEASALHKYACVFIDSITVASRLCLSWVKTQPEALSERTGKPDPRGAYGLLAQEMLTWISQFQHIPNKDIIFVGILEQKVDEFNTLHWLPQIEGAKTAHELPGILDEVISMVALPQESDKPTRAFVCQTINPWKYPAKDRSGRLDLIEEPHLGKLLAKIKTTSKSTLNPT